MITDALLLLSGINTPGTTISGQAITATAVSTNTISLGTARDIGEGTNLYAVFTVVTATFITGTSLTMEIIGTTNAALTSGIVSLGSTGAITLASGGLALGKQHVVRINLQRASLGTAFIGGRYTVGGSNFANGEILCNIVTEIQDGMKFHDSGFTVA